MKVARIKAEDARIDYQCGADLYVQAHMSVWQVLFGNDPSKSYGLSDIISEVLQERRQQIVNQYFHEEYGEATENREIHLRLIRTVANMLGLPDISQGLNAIGVYENVEQLLVRFNQAYTLDAIAEAIRTGLNEPITMGMLKILTGQPLSKEAACLKDDVLRFIAKYMKAHSLEDTKSIVAINIYDATTADDYEGFNLSPVFITYLLLELGFFMKSEIAPEMINVLIQSGQIDFKEIADVLMRDEITKAEDLLGFDPSTKDRQGRTLLSWILSVSNREYRFQMVARFRLLYVVNSAEANEAQMVDIISSTRAAIRASSMTDWDKSDAVIDLYSCVQEKLTPEFISIERAAIRASRMGDREKAANISVLFNNCGKENLTPDLISSERAAILDSSMEDWEKADAVRALVVCGKENLTPEFISIERAAILDSRMEDREKVEAVSNLFACGKETLTPELILIERAAIWDSSMGDQEKASTVRALFECVKETLTPALISSERAAILDSRMISLYKELAFRDLYEFVKEKLTPEYISSERAAIRASRMGDREKADAVRALFECGKENLTPELILIERAAIWASSMKDQEKVKIVIALFESVKETLTPELILIERAAIWDSSMGDQEKADAVRALYSCVQENLTPEFISSERAAISNSSMTDLSKSIAISSLDRKFRTLDLDPSDRPKKHRRTK